MNLVKRINQFANHQRTIRALKQLDGRLLADIGIAREDIPAAVRRHAL